jgi:integrase/recombinase XerC
MLDNGADILAIKELLGHATLSTTQLYTHMSRQKLSEVYRKTHPRS